jgi:hypothetical protein
MAERAEGGQQDKNAVEILKMLAEYEGRQQFASTAASAKTNVFALLRADPEFKRLNLGRDAVAAIVTQSQRAGWIERLLYRTPQRKDAERWTVTNKGKQWAGLPFAPSAPSAPSCHVSADSAQGASPKGEGAPSAPSS